MKEHNEPAVSAPLCPDYRIADTLIHLIRRERACLSDPTWGPFARDRIEEARRALIPFGDAPYFLDVRYELIVWALDESARIEVPVESPKKHAGHHDAVLQHRASFVRVVVCEAIPGAQIPSDVLLDAVRLWPATKQRQARTDAIRALARALDCDTPSLMTMLRQARRRLRDRRRRTT